MTARPLQQDPASALQSNEAPAEWTARVRREAAVIAKGHADIDAGNGLEDDDLEAWLDQLDHNENTPPPLPTGPTPRR